MSSNTYKQCIQTVTNPGVQNIQVFQTHHENTSKALPFWLRSQLHCAYTKTQMVPILPLNWLAVGAGNQPMFFRWFLFRSVMDHKKFFRFMIHSSVVSFFAVYPNLGVGGVNVSKIHFLLSLLGSCFFHTRKTKSRASAYTLCYFIFAKVITSETRAS